MDKKWIYLLILALLVLLIGLFSNTWTVGSINESQDGKIQNQDQQLKDQQERLKKQDEKIKQLNKKLESKLLKQQLASKATPQAPSSPTAQLSSVTSVKSSCAKYKSLIAKYPWNVDVAMKVMSAESGCNSNAVSYTNDHGLFQINNGLALYGSKIYDPAFNVSVAYWAKYKPSNWNPWTVCTRGIVSCWI